jgi:hypothetical protein
MTTLFPDQNHHREETEPATNLIATMEKAEPKASEAVMQISELVDMIAAKMQFEDLLNLRQVSKFHKAIVDGSTELQMHLFKQPAPCGALGFDRAVVHNDLQGHITGRITKEDDGGTLPPRRTYWIRTGACAEKKCNFIVPTNEQSDEEMSKIWATISEPNAFFHPLIRKYAPGFERAHFCMRWYDYHHQASPLRIRNKSTILRYRVDKFTVNEFETLTNEVGAFYREGREAALTPTAWKSMFCTQPPVKQVSFLWYNGDTDTETNESYVSERSDCVKQFIHDQNGVSLYSFMTVLRASAIDFHRGFVRWLDNVRVVRWSRLVIELSRQPLVGSELHEKWAMAPHRYGP